LRLGKDHGYDNATEPRGASLSPDPAGQIPAVHAQMDFNHVYVEPGTTMLRDPDTGPQTQGKVVIDRRTGDVWGFPTASSVPYPIVPARKEPPVSKPIYLGKFDFASMRSR